MAVERLPGLELQRRDDLLSGAEGPPWSRGAGENAGGLLAALCQCLGAGGRGTTPSAPRASRVELVGVFQSQADRGVDHPLRDTDQEDRGRLDEEMRHPQGGGLDRTRGGNIENNVRQRQDIRFAR